MATGKAGRYFALALGIKPDPYRHHTGLPDRQANVDDGKAPYYETDPTVAEFLRQNAPTGRKCVGYLRSLFPFWSWIFHYNTVWLFGDVVAGITVGFVVVPQSTAYAVLANLPPEYGLYTSFVGLLVYWLFATSKDATIGAVSVMSMVVGNSIMRVQAANPDIAADDVARALALAAGCILLCLGFLRAGFIVEFISAIAVESFMTGASITIAVGQVPSLLGISGINSRDPTYEIVITVLRRLGDIKLDAAMGLTALALLYFIRWFCLFMKKRKPRYEKALFFLSTLRIAFVVMFSILLSWLISRDATDLSQAKLRILGPVPRGFQKAGLPRIDANLLSTLAPDVPTTLIVLVIEHIATSKSFGRINNYIVDPSQEFVALGFSNVFGPFLGGYPATGSFSRSAINAKAGVRTPLAGIFTAVVVLLALYALTSVFAYTPMSVLAALIIHAVCDLITPPKAVYQFWRTSPLEAVLFLAGVFIDIFTDMGNGVYLNMIASAVLLLLRTGRSSGRFLGRAGPPPASVTTGDTRQPTRPGEASLVCGSSGNLIRRDLFLPLDRSDGSNPAIPLSSPYPGVFVYRFSNGFNYLNAAKHLDCLSIHIRRLTRRSESNVSAKKGDRPWNDPIRASFLSEDIGPPLRAVILDFSGVGAVDVTSVQALVDLRAILAHHAGVNPVAWHLAAVNDRWSRRALVAAGFGVAPAPEPGPGPARVGDEEAASPGTEGEKTPAGQSSVSTSELEVRSEEDGPRAPRSETDSHPEEAAEEGRRNERRSSPTATRNPDGDANRILPIYGLNRPFFHVDVAAAVESAALEAETREAR